MLQETRLELHVAFHLQAAQAWQTDNARGTTLRIQEGKGVQRFGTTPTVSKKQTGKVQASKAVAAQKSVFIQ